MPIPLRTGNLDGPGSHDADFPSRRKFRLALLPRPVLRHGLSRFQRATGVVEAIRRGGSRTGIKIRRAEAVMTDKLINRDPDILGGTPVFSGTRVPVRILMEHLEAGDRVAER